MRPVFLTKLVIGLGRGSLGAACRHRHGRCHEGRLGLGIGFAIRAMLRCQGLFQRGVALGIDQVVAQDIAENQALPHLAAHFAEMEVMRAPRSRGGQAFDEEQAIAFRIFRPEGVAQCGQRARRDLPRGLHGRNRHQDINDRLGGHSRELVPVDFSLCH